MNKGMKNLTGSMIETTSGTKYKLVRIIGYGGQGVVYETDTNNKAIKFYYPDRVDVSNTDLLRRLRYIQHLRLPENFVGIDDIVETPYIGYVMTKLNGFKPLSTYLIPDKELSYAEWYNRGQGLRERVLIGRIIAKAFEALERENLSYCDISPNNILVKVGNKIAVRMIDADNIYTPGKGICSVIGTPRYIAPEVISRTKYPDVLSDNYSLAVILFELLRVGHPYISDDILNGTPEDEDAALAGTYDYVTDENSSNMLPADAVFTESLRGLFKRCFVDGKQNRLTRPLAWEYMAALYDASNKLMKCPDCEAWYYPRKHNKTYDGCPWCDKVSRPKARINFYKFLYDRDDHKRVGETTINNSYILHEGMNQIYDIDIFGAAESFKNDVGDQQLVIVMQPDRYLAYNKYAKNGIWIRKQTDGTYMMMSSQKQEEKTCKAGERLELKAKDAISLAHGDCIYFNQDVTSTAGNRSYTYVHAAVLQEER